MSNFLPTDYQSFIHTSRYARYLDDEQRRETWPETVARYFDFMTSHLKAECSYDLPPALRAELEDAVLSLEVMPSMRALMTAGPALARNHIAAYNCAFNAVDDLRAFDEAMFILMCGTGVGFSVEEKFTSKLPVVPAALKPITAKIIVEDSKEGWCSAYRALIDTLFKGKIPRIDYREIRPAGARLKTFGGRASGPEPLKALFEFTIEKVNGARGRQLTPLECHDIMCKIGEVVVVGGVRRSALISLSDLSSTEMAKAKSGAWWEKEGQRALANNSYVLEERPSVSTFLGEWHALFDSHSGERGIFSRVAARNQTDKFSRDPNWSWGCNPCSEILLRGPGTGPNEGRGGGQYCNLSEIVVRSTDTHVELLRKVRLATILGTFQSTLVRFPYIRQQWADNTAEERLLGVSLTGILDNARYNNPHDPMLPGKLEDLRDVSITVNALMALELGIPSSAAITCVKPSGTVSQLVDSASGLHTRHSPFYIRTVRGDNKDPLTQFMIAQGVPSEPCVMKPDSTTVFSFPQKAPQGALTRDSLTAVQHLDLWLLYQRFWCMHKPSVTITYKDGEFMDIGAWVWKNLDEISGISLLPHSDHTYQQAPYQACSEADYQALVAKMPRSIDWASLSQFEITDSTTGTQELACTAGGCEITDI
jgi:ribonucleoside-triphosphate reductase